MTQMSQPGHEHTHSTDKKTPKFPVPYTPLKNILALTPCTKKLLSPRVLYSMLVAMGLVLWYMVAVCVVRQVPRLSSTNKTYHATCSKPIRRQIP